MTIESIATFDIELHEDIQKLHFLGDLILQQRGLLSSESLYETYNDTVEMVDHSLEELLMQNLQKKC